MDNNSNYMHHVNDSEVHAVKQNLSITGVAVKAIIGMLVTLVAAIGSFLLFGQLIFVGFVGLVASIALFVIMRILLSKLVAGTQYSLLFFLVLCSIEGLILASATGFIAFAAENYFSLDVSLIYGAALLAALGTAISLVATLIVVINVKIETLNSKIFTNIGRMLTGLMVAILLFATVSFVLGLFFNSFATLYIDMMIGYGFIGILVSVVFLAYAQYFLFVVLLQIKQMRATGASKHLEYAAATLLVAAIVNLYIELFRLIIRLLARSSD